MGCFVRVVALAVLLLLGVVAAALFLLPRFVDHPRARAWVHDTARDLAGREIRYETLSLHLFPPRVVVEGASVAGDGEGAEPLVEARAMHLRLAAGPLLRGELEVGSLRFDGAVLRLVRNEDGFEPLLSDDDAGAPDDEASGGRSPAGLPPLRRLSLVDSRLVIDDRGAREPVVWSIAGLAGAARTSVAGDSLGFELEGRLESGGRVGLVGTWHEGGDLDLAAQLDAVDPTPIRAYLAPDRRLSGRVSGAVTLGGPAGAPSQVVADLALSDGELRIGRVHLLGAVTLHGELSGAPLTGPFELDATEAELDYDNGAFAKPPGTPAHATGRVVPSAEGGLTIDDLRVHIRNLDAQGQLRSGERTRYRLAAEPFDIGRFGGMVRALRDRNLSGPIRSPGLTLFSKPFEMFGELELEGVRMPVGTKGELVLHGTLLADGRQIRSRELEARIGGERATLDFSLADLGKPRPYDIRIRTAGADARGLAQGLLGSPGRLEGPLSLDARLSGEGSAGRPTISTLQGRIEVDAGPGRLEGVSLLRVTFDRIGAIGKAARVAGGLLGGGVLLPFYDDDYEFIRGSFYVADGVAHTENLRIQRPHHRFELRGEFGLVDRHVNATGTLVLGAKLDEALASRGRASGRKGREHEVPLAHIGGTLDEPQVEVTKRAVVAFLGVYTLTSALGRITGTIGEMGERALDEAGRVLLPDEQPEEADE